MSRAAAFWEASQDYAERCLNHPFLQGLGDGSLPPASYRIFIAQDAFFLDVFARGYAYCAEHAPDEEGAAAFRRLLDGVFAELELHASAAADLDIDLDRVEPLPSTLAYTRFLEECIEEGVGTGLTVASMAPCMRLYAYLGQALAAADTDPGPYREWVETYASDDMETLAQTIDALLDRYVGPADQDEARARYRRAMQLEYDFFDAAWTEGASARRGDSPTEAMIEAHANEWRVSTAGAAFIRGVSDGSLDEAAFERWLAQDRQFVAGLVTAQLRIATRARDDAQRVLFDGVRGLEEELDWFAGQADSRDIDLEVEPTETCAAFVGYLDTLAAAPPAVALTAIWTVERAYLDAWTAARPGADPYREFVDHWSNDEFRGYVDALQDAADAALAEASDEEREQAQEAFREVMNFERRFWRMAETGAIAC